MIKRYIVRAELLDIVNILTFCGEQHGEHETAAQG